MHGRGAAGRCYCCGVQARAVMSHEADEVDALVRSAFLTAPVSDGCEQDLVKRLRSSPGYLPDLELVAVEEGRIVGHILTTRITIDGRTGPVDALEVAPLCVALERRGRGLGAQLMEETLRRGRAAGFPAVFLVGDPRYYGRFGFRPVAELGIRNAGPVPDDVVLGVALMPDVLEGVGGSVTLL